VLAASDSALELVEASVRRGRRLVLDRISLATPRGVIMGVIGPNGAGKSTLLSAACGLLRPAAGTVRVLGQDLARAGGGELAKLRRRIGLLPQLSQVNELSPLSAREVVEIGRVGLTGLGRRLRPLDREAVDRAMAMFELGPLARVPYQRLSGGERRKTHLARVFAQGPELLLLDEPMSNLDMSWIESLRCEIERVWKELGATVIMVAHETHHLPGATSLIAVLGHGRLLGLGPPEQVLEERLLSQAYGAGAKVMTSAGRTYIMGAGR
jgi:ABC-type cobalamin/Fe3+-siderophores transport system ATPase subunit